jgi:AcrR family transcriptional regulator
VPIYIVALLVSIEIDIERAISYNGRVEPPTVKQDGRHARLERNKTEVVRALLALIRQTGEVPTADVLAERAQVSRRSVFRLFDDRASLLRAASDFMYRELLEKFPFPALSGLPIAKRVVLLVDHLASIYEYVTPIRRVTENAKARDDLVENERGRIQSLYLQQIRTGFLDVVPKEATISGISLETMQLILSWKAWDYLRHERKHSVDRAKAVVVYGLTVLLSPTGIVD